MKKNKEDGFLLIEFIIVIALILIMMNIVILKTDIIYKVRLNKEVNKLERDINYLRLNALKHKKNTSIIFTGKNTYLLKESKGNIGLDTKEKVSIKTFTIDSTYTDYKFKANGSPEKGGTIKIKHKDGRWELTISPVTGKLNLKK